MTRVVIIGHESAGFTAARQAKLADRNAEITVIERRAYPLYHPCDIPFAISGEIALDSLVENVSSPHVELQLESNAEEINPDERTVKVRELKNGRTKTVPYDSLILATGSRPFIPQVPGINLNGVYEVRTVENANAIIEAAKKAKKAVVIGGGAIGVETSIALRHRGLEVTLIEMRSHILPTALDQDMSELVTEKLRKEGVRVLCGQALDEIAGGKSVSSVISGGAKYSTDMVVMATGTMPETKLARDAGLKLGATGGIKVDQYLHTSDPDIFAAGDCVETRNIVTGEPTLPQTASTAMRMGKIAGENAVGWKKRFEGTLNTLVTSINGLVIGSTGVTTKKAENAGMKVISARIRALDRPAYRPEATPIYVKLIVEFDDRRLVGGQVIGMNGVAERVNLLSLAVQNGMHVDELANMEYCYMPAVTATVEPLAMAAEAVLRKL